MGGFQKQLQDGGHLLLSSSLWETLVYYPIFQMAVFTRASAQATFVYFDAYSFCQLQLLRAILTEICFFLVQRFKIVNLQMIQPYFNILAHYHHYCQFLPEHWTYSNYTLQNFFKLFFLNCRYLDILFCQILLFNFILFLLNSKILSSMQFYESVFITFIIYGKVIYFHYSFSDVRENRDFLFIQQRLIC